eukprot:CAMPEP_0113474630 /NCGR_PEP_ID=MMETSP0014_2-20120614/18689_1 /TAXON_ID=2857 /ORGANISM="Nitzschia sp." /LENGTH=306 /DNA_ID=CAMNT_0000367495 /DNA_START=107 /DNA_END=1027 /DNA_ORIENTATION=- /assembly_acc=CAM_ASM_000159
MSVTTINKKGPSKAVMGSPPQLLLVSYCCCCYYYLALLLHAASVQGYTTPIVKLVPSAAISNNNNNYYVYHRPATTSSSSPSPSSTTSSSSSQLSLFDKIFEEDGPLGKGITVGKIQIALQTPPGQDRTSPSSIFSLLEDHTSVDSNANEDLARMTNNVCLDLMRLEDQWVAACASSEWFPSKDSGKAESRYNDLSNLEASKFEKEYIPDDDDGDDDDESSSTSSSSTLVVVSLVVEIQGDSTTFDAGAGYSLVKTKEVLASIASDALVDDGYCVNAVEIFWTPSDRTEVMTKQDMIIDFPELIDL